MKSVLDTIADACGGKITEVGGPLPDGSGFALMSMPLPKTHWIYDGEKHTWGVSNIPPMPFRTGANETVYWGKSGDGQSKIVGMFDRDGFADRIRSAGKYAVRCATMNGAEMDFDPDALLQNLVVGMLGLWTETGLSGEGWGDPPGGGGANWKPEPKKESVTISEDIPEPTSFNPDFEV